MAESVLSLATTLARIRALAKERQLDLDEILDAEALAARTGVPAEVTAALLRGEEFAEPTPEEARATVHRRAAFLHATSRDTDGRPYAVADIAAAIGAPPEWVDHLVSGVPLAHLGHCGEFAAFFGREPAFLTDTPARALDRALQPAVRSLDNGPGDLLAELTDHYGLVSISTRGRTLSRTQETLLLGMITSMLSAEEVR
ncbi:hypothetical protein ACFXJO_30930 [Streptomyces lavendulae]|uniref:hypothetical protein n=1 Tax=Streptomyces lavendulae TaxID=1914 RepID=UPI0036A971F6